MRNPLRYIYASLFVLAALFTFGVKEVHAQGSGCAYIDRNSCVPGLISEESWYTPAPTHIVGKAVWYAPFVMEATAEWREMALDGFLGGVSLFSPADIGEIVWIKRPGHAWEGPFLVVDASQRNHMYTTLTFVKESVEVDFDTALRWGMVEWDDINVASYTVNDWMIRGVEVYKGLTPPGIDEIPVNYGEWFMETVEFDDANHAHWVFDETKIANYEEYLAASDGISTDTVASKPNENVVLQAIGLPSGSNKAKVSRKLSTSVVASTQIMEIPPELTYKDAHLYHKLDERDFQVVDSVSWEVNCDDNNPYTGFWTLNECAPGVVTKESWMLPIPKHTIGVATYYMPGVMETVLKNRQMSLDGYKDGIVLMSCAHIGESVYLKRPGLGWEGPYLVVDCSQPFHMWVNVASRHLHIEVDQARWLEWRDSTGTQNIELCMGGANCSGNPVSYWYLWEKSAQFLFPK